MGTQKIKIGVLFSQTGPMAVTEKAHLQGVLLACEEINARGGIDGCLLDPIVMDPAGEDRRYAQIATELLLRHRVNVIFGCCLSSSRKVVVPVIERFNGILFYPSVYEGFEYSPNVIYGGAVPNQLVLPLLEYVYSQYGKNIALIGSDTLYAREINRVVGEFSAGSSGKIVSEAYLPFGVDPTQAKAKLREAVARSPDVILSTVVGGDSITLYSAYADLDLGLERAPFASLTTTESELAHMPAPARAGHIAVGPYFGTQKSENNQRFVQAFQARFRADTRPGVYSEVAYSLVHFFADAVRVAEQLGSDAILSALSGAVFKSPGGDLSIDLETKHFTLRPQVAKSTPDGDYEIVWSSSEAIRPDPYLIAYDRTIGKTLTA